MGIGWKREAGAALRGEIRALVAGIPGAPGLRGRVREALAASRPGTGCSTAGARPWPLLPLLVYYAIAGSYRAAVPLAAALELLKAAAEVFDDVEDADSPRSLAARYGPAVAVNTGTALLMLAEKALGLLAEAGGESRLAGRVCDHVNSCYLAACAGQHRELSATPGKPITEKEYLKAAGIKSAFAVEGACTAAALLAAGGPAIVELFGEFGHNLGMAAQIANDLRGITSGNDIARGKITLPAIFALTQARGRDRGDIEAAFLRPADRPAPPPEKVRELLFRSGAVHYAAVKMEYYRQRAGKALDDIEAAGIETRLLRPFLE